MKWIVVLVVAVASVGKIQPFGLPDFGSIDMNGDGIPDFQMGSGSGSFARSGSTSKLRLKIGHN